jgi:hypothetical protein
VEYPKHQNERKKKQYQNSGDQSDALASYQERSIQNIPSSGKYREHLITLIKHSNHGISDFLILVTGYISLK